MLANLTQHVVRIALILVMMMNLMGVARASYIQQGELDAIIGRFVAY